MATPPLILPPAIKKNQKKPREYHETEYKEMQIASERSAFWLCCVSSRESQRAHLTNFPSANKVLQQPLGMASGSRESCVKNSIGTQPSSSTLHQSMNEGILVDMRLLI